eukprot:9274753-Pyramimonas_sp.AAC.2
MIHALLVQQAESLPLVRAQSLVGDCLLQALGANRLVAEQLPSASALLVRRLHERRLRVNWGKTGWMASDPARRASSRPVGR